MKTPLFVFLGVVENGTDANIVTLKVRLKNLLLNIGAELKFEIKDELLTVTIKASRFCFYISFINNDHKTLSEWEELAKDFELPWDIKPVDKFRLADTCVYLESNGWAEYRDALKFGYTILSEMERFSHVKVFTIPSVGKPTIGENENSSSFPEF